VISAVVFAALLSIATASGSSVGLIHELLLHYTTAAAANLHLSGPRNGGDHGGGGDTASISDALDLREQANNSSGAAVEQPELGNWLLYLKLALLNWLCQTGYVALALLLKLPMNTAIGCIVSVSYVSLCRLSMSL
jgi:hypothetical protein